MYEAVIIGGGPAGYTAGIYLGRGQRSTLMLAGEKAGGQLMLTTGIENFPGSGAGVQGPELMERMRDQAVRFGTEIKNEDVVEVSLEGKIKQVKTSDNIYEAKAIIIATGARAKMIGVGEEVYYGRGMSTCAVCDAAFFKGKRVAVVGGGDAAMEDALALTKFAVSVDLIHRREAFRASKIMQERVLGNNKINVMWNSEVVMVKGEKKIESVVIKNVKSGKELEMKLEGLFLAVGHEPETGLLKGKVELDEKGFLVIGKDVNYPMKTSVEGVFGAGDVADFRYKQAVTAAGMGCQAALDVERYLEERD